MSTTDKRYATRDFKDDGTGKSFKRGEPVEATPGEIANYEAGGLLGDKPAEDAKPAPTDGKAKTAS